MLVSLLVEKEKLKSVNLYLNRKAAMNTNERLMYIRSFGKADND